MTTRRLVSCFLPAACVTVFLTGCGAAAPNQAPVSVSTWAGNYTGTLNFSGCESSATSCGGDAVSITISEAASGDEFSPTLTITGTDSTTEEAITGTGTALYDGAAPVGPGNEDTNANATITPGGAIFLAGTGQSATGLIQTIAVNNAVTVTGEGVVKGPIYFGALTRVQ